MSSMLRLSSTKQCLNGHCTRWIVISMLLLLGCEGLESLRGDSTRKGRELLATEAVVARIFEGESAPKGRYDFMVSLRSVSTNKHFCGGVLVEPDVVLTAAHCVVSKSDTLATPNPKVVIGGHQVDRDDSGEVREVCSTIIHIGWNGIVENGYDIALLILKSPSSKKPISYKNYNELSVGQSVSALGWGFIDNQRSTPPELQVVNNLAIVSTQSCGSQYGTPTTTQGQLLCADGSMGEDTCNGDSGGPLFLDRGFGSDELVGITSFGPGECGTIGLPGVYTKVSNFITWIQKRGQGESNVITVPFCRGATPLSRKDRLAALLADRNIDSAAVLIGEMVTAGEIQDLGSTIAKVSEAGLAEIAVEAVLKAAQNGVSEEILSKAMSIATQELPASDKVVGSGGGITQNEEMIMASIRNGDISGAADGIAKAIRNSDAEAVLQAVRKSVSEGRSSVVGDVLETAIRSNGVDAVELATILSPLCGSDEECASFLMQIAKTGL